MTRHTFICDVCKYINILSNSTDYLYEVSWCIYVMLCKYINILSNSTDYLNEALWCIYVMLALCQYFDLELEKNLTTQPELMMSIHCQQYRPAE